MSYFKYIFTEFNCQKCNKGNNFIRKLNNNNNIVINKINNNNNYINVPKGNRMSPRNKISPRSKLNLNKKINMNVRKLQNNQKYQTFQNTLPGNSFNNMNNNNNISQNLHNNLANRQQIQYPINQNVIPSFAANNKFPVQYINPTGGQNQVRRIVKKVNQRSPKYGNIPSPHNMMNINPNVRPNAGVQYPNNVGNNYNNFGNIQYRMANNQMFGI